MGYRNESNEIVGFDVDVAKEVAKRMGVELKLQPIDWSQKFNELNAGTIDCIWNGYTITEERLQQTNVTSAYMKKPPDRCRTADSPVQSLADLAGKKLALQAESSAAEALESILISKPPWAKSSNSKTMSLPFWISRPAAATPCSSMKSSPDTTSPVKANSTAFSTKPSPKRNTALVSAKPTRLCAMKFRSSSKPWPKMAPWPRFQPNGSAKTSPPSASNRSSLEPQPDSPRSQNQQTRGGQA